LIKDKYPARVRVVEVSPRDGLQNEPVTVDVATKAALIEALAAAGLGAIECGSFVSPKRVPQMANTAEVLATIRRVPGVAYSVLVPNLQGLEAAIDSQAAEIAIFAAASESFSQHNIQCSIAESLSRLRKVADGAMARRMRVRGYVSCVLGCPYEGAVQLDAVTHVARELAGMGCYEVALGDTIGVGTPRAAQAMITKVAEHVPIGRLAVHFHDTYGQALANILAALQLGVAVVDAAVAGLGGCPYAPGATGNVATEDVVYMLNGMGIETGVDLEKLTAAGRAISQALGRESQSKAAAAIARKISRAPTS
jgi:hydroxymethylglutaryl-CoA lyase